MHEAILFDGKEKHSENYCKVVENRVVTKEIAQVLAKGKRHVSKASNAFLTVVFCLLTYKLSEKNKQLKNFLV